VGSPWGGTWFVDVDQDGDEDLLFGVLDGVPSIRVRKYDSGTQTFAPVSEHFLNVDLGECATDALSPALASAPLAVSDINYDGFPDFVDEAGILLYDPDPLKAARICNANAKPTIDPNPQKDPQGWAHAVVGDFNGDGLRDIVASRKNEGVLDLWVLHPEGNFNTQTIFVSGVVEELVLGDFDGDLISDAAYRLKPPPMMMGMGVVPDPLFAIFGNPLALPSSPQLLGFIENAQHMVAGRIKGTNLVSIPDPISDLAVISAPKSPLEPMPLTLIQGNVTRNLISPLSLKADATQAKVDLTDTVYGVIVSEFGKPACDTLPQDPNSPPNTNSVPSNVVALGSTGKIWLAGCKSNGSSLPVPVKLDLGDVSFLFAPVDRDSTEDALAVFMRKDAGLGLGVVEYKGQEQFDWSKPEKLESINAAIRLPRPSSPDAPFAFADMDKNKVRDVILTGYENGQRKVFIFWNDDSNATPGTFNTTAITEFVFDPDSLKDAGPSDGSPIVDIAPINFDGDDFMELAILTNNNVYIAELKKVREEGVETKLAAVRSLELLPDINPFANVRGGQAILAIDANSDGIEDLIVADTGKLLLYIGKEQFSKEEEEEEEQSQ
jgi:hypothetical protein